MSSPRVVVDPNSFSRLDPAWSLVRLTDITAPVAVGDVVVAEQPDDDGVMTFTAVVRGVDPDYDLAHLEVFWAMED